MRWLNSWASGVIVAIIVATILEMLLPEGNNKKYIKVIIGIYLLFTIISPVISNFSEKDFNIEAVFASATEYEYQKEEINTDKVILSTYINNLKEEIKQKLVAKGYNTNTIEIKVGNGNNDYGYIQKINISISKIKEKNEIEEIEQIDIKISKANEEKNKISQNEIKELKKYLAKAYEIEENNIIIE